MEQITDNMQKYENYKEQMRRLKRSLDAQFYKVRCYNRAIDRQNMKEGA